MTPRKDKILRNPFRGVFSYVYHIILRWIPPALYVGLLVLAPLVVGWKFYAPPYLSMTVSVNPEQSYGDSAADVYWNTNSAIFHSGLFQDQGVSDVYNHQFAAYINVQYSGNPPPPGNYVGYTHGWLAHTNFQWQIYPSNVLYTYYLTGSDGTNIYPGRVDIAYAPSQFGAQSNEYFNMVGPGWFTNPQLLGTADYGTYSTATYLSNTCDGVNQVLTASTNGLPTFTDLGPNQVNSAPYWNQFYEPAWDQQDSATITNGFFIEFHPAPFLFDSAQGIVITNWTFIDGVTYITWQFYDAGYLYTNNYSGPLVPVSIVEDAWDIESGPWGIYGQEQQQNFVVPFTYTQSMAFADSVYTATGMKSGVGYTNDLTPFMTDYFMAYPAQVMTIFTNIPTRHKPDPSCDTCPPYYQTDTWEIVSLVITPTNREVWAWPGDLVPDWYGYTNYFGAWPGMISFNQDQSGWNKKYQQQGSTNSGGGSDTQ